MITTIIMIDIIWNFSPPHSHPGHGSFPSDSWTMDMALSKYQYTKGKHWYFKNAGKKRDGIISLFRILRYLFTYDACKDPNNRSDTETGTLSKLLWRKGIFVNSICAIYAIWRPQSPFFDIFASNVPVTCVKEDKFQVCSNILLTIKCRLRWILKESLVPRASTLGISDMGICRRKIMDSSQNRARQGDDPGIVEIPRNKI